MGGDDSKQKLATALEALFEEQPTSSSSAESALSDEKNGKKPKTGAKQIDEQLVLPQAVAAPAVSSIPINKTMTNS